jgi:RNA polymerase sigma-70 factor, ECF subfamily
VPAHEVAPGRISCNRGLSPAVVPSGPPFRRLARLHPLPDDLDALLRRALGYAHALTHDATAAEDAVQEACVRVLRARGEWNVPYFFRAVRTVIVDRWRQDRLRPVVALDPSELEALGGSEDPFAGSERLPCSPAEMLDLLGALRPEEREALYLLAVEGMTATEAASTLQKPRGTILSLAHRAKAKLRRAAHAAAREDGTANAALRENGR